MFPKENKPKNRIYLDFAATTPVDKSVLSAMMPFFAKDFGNPSSLYEEGGVASSTLANSRSIIAKILSCKAGEIVFTAGGTESVNLAIFGVSKRYHKGSKAHFITTNIEHHAVLRSFEELERQGFKVTYVKADSNGLISAEDIKEAVRPETVFISAMYANNEVGSILPIAEIGKWLRGLNNKRRQKNLPQILFHTDASQAAGALNLDVDRLGVDLLTLNGSKIYGPKQSGLLYVRSGTKLEPLIYGGGQEKNLRSGTENVPGVVGLAKAMELVQKNHKKENKKIIQLRDYFYNEIRKKIPKVKLNGPALGPSRLPNNLNVSFEGLEGESLMLYLDAYGVSAATGSACASAGTEPSHVLSALGLTKKQLQGSIRFTLGKTTTEKEIDFVLKILPGIVGELRKTQGLDI